MLFNTHHRWICVSITTVVALASLTGGCGTTLSDKNSESTDQQETDAKHASFLAEEKEDIGPVTPGSPEAAGILSLVNEASYQELDDDVGLDRRAAYHIASYRMGDDDTPGTDDDRQIDSLQELDDVYWVGPHAISQLLDYAENNGYVKGALTTVHGIPTESDDALGLLRLANEASHSTLDDDVGLDVRAADHIVAHRAGADEKLGTADDEYFERLAELDDVTWVAKRAFGKLLTYAENHRYIPADTWRDIFDRGEVQVTLEPISGSCERRRCLYTRHGATGQWDCQKTEIDDFRSVADVADLRITGQNPGELTAAYTAEATNDAWVDPIEDDGEFTLGGQNNANGNAVTDTREVSGSLYRDYVHSATYSHTYKTEQKRDFLDCSLTLERTDQ